MIELCRNDDKMKRESELISFYRKNEIAGCCFFLGILYSLFRSDRGFPNWDVFIFVNGPEWF